MLKSLTVLSCLLSLPLFAANPGTLKVGAAKVDITPASDPAVPPSGKFEHEHLYVRAIVLDNGTTRAALIGADQANMPDTVWTRRRSKSPKN